MKADFTCSFLSGVSIHSKSHFSLFLPMAMIACHSLLPQNRQSTFRTSNLKRQAVIYQNAVVSFAMLSTEFSSSSPLAVLTASQTHPVFTRRCSSSCQASTNLAGFQSNPGIPEPASGTYNVVITGSTKGVHTWLDGGSAASHMFRLLTCQNNHSIFLQNLAYETASMTVRFLESRSSACRMNE